jgi:hypothetical protein
MKSNLNAGSFVDEDCDLVVKQFVIFSFRSGKIKIALMNTDENQQVRHPNQFVSSCY